MYVCISIFPCNDYYVVIQVCCAAIRFYFHILQYIGDVLINYCIFTGDATYEERILLF